jgi:multidrug efflux pump subunit AcrA (membrane-fusion protein)
VKSSAGEPASAEATPRRSARLLEEIAQLLQSSLSPAEFHAEYLQRVLAALRGVAGAVWGRSPQGHFHLQYQINTVEVGLERITNARACHAELLRLASERDRPLWVPPHSGPDTADGRICGANLTDYGLLLAPILVDNEVAGLVEVWQDFYQDSQMWRASGRLLAELAGFAAAYQHRNRLRHLQQQQQLLTQTEALARQVHGSLRPREVAYLVANQGRLLAGCDQLAVAARTGGKVRVEAVSGAGDPDRRSRLVRCQRDLFAAALAWGEKVVYHGARDDSLPPAVLEALDAYLAESNSKTLFLLPLRDEREPDPHGCRGGLLAECFEAPASLEQLERRLTLVAGHAGTALYNAVEHARVPFSSVTRPLLRAGDWGRRGGWWKLGIGLAALLLVAGALAVIPAPLRLSARGQLLPQQRQIVFAPFLGKVVELKAQHGERVARGQELLFLEDRETQLKVEQLGIKVSAAEHRLALLNDQIAKAAADEERDSLIKDRISQEYELRKALAERAILLQGSRSPRKTPVAAPLTGKVVTFDAREQLVGKTVKPGDPLLRVAAAEGPWEVELLLPEGSLGPIREALRAAPDEAVDVDLLLMSQPHRTYKGKLYRDGLGGETTVKDGAVVLPARVRLTDPELIDQLETLPVGVEVRAKVHCGRHAVGYVWFFDLWEFLYEHVLF